MSEKKKCIGYHRHIQGNPIRTEEHFFGDYNLCQCGIFRDNKDGTCTDMRTNQRYPWKVERGHRALERGE